MRYLDSPDVQADGRIRRIRRNIHRLVDRGHLGRNQKKHLAEIFNGVAAGKFDADKLAVVEWFVELARILDEDTEKTVIICSDAFPIHIVHRVYKELMHLKM